MRAESRRGWRAGSPVLPHELVLPANTSDGIGGWREGADDGIDDVVDERLGDALARDQEPGPHRADEEVDDDLLVDAGVELVTRDGAVEDASVGEPPGVDDGVQE